MKATERMLKSLLLGLMLSPLRTCRNIARICTGPQQGDQSQLRRLRETTRQAPLILQIETTNICNAHCIFCAYPRMQRPKGTMSMALFNKVLDDYAAMGGGPVSLTPVVGDALLDPHLIERLQILRARPLVNQVTMTTNAIALDRYSDADVTLLLETLDSLQISLGGLDQATYRALFGVDRLQQVLAAIDRLLTLNARLSSPANLILAFRTNDWTFEVRFRRRLDEYRHKGAFVSHIWSFTNYSGVVESNRKQALQVIASPRSKGATCVYPCVHMAVCWDGTVTACGCADFDADSLKVGHVDGTSLTQLWFGEQRGRILDAFEKRRLPRICRDCSAYQRDTLFAQPLFRGIAPHQPLPLHYLQQFWGG